jgi:hypothetical protein
MNGYQSPFFNPYGFMQPQTIQQQTTQVVKVNGENGARAYNIGANSSALLLDESGTIVWLVTSDGAGYRTVSAYDITPHQSVQAPDYSSLESRMQTVEKKLEEMIANGNTRNAAPTRKVKSDDGSD